jgi:hypothetical protein
MKRVLPIAVALSSIALPASAHAAATFALDPQGASSARGYYVFTGGPERTLHGRVRVVNTGNRPGTVLLYAVDAATGATTGAVYHAQEDPRSDVGAWTTLRRSSVRLAPGKSAFVGFTVRVPPGAQPGDHLGGIVAEDSKQRRGGEVRRGRGRFTIRVRSLTIVAVQVRVPGARHASLALTSLRAGGDHARQSLLLGIRNDGNVLVKGRGRLTVTDADGDRVQDARFPVDTFVPGTGVELPVAVARRALPAGSYSAVAELRYRGRTTRRSFAFSISNRQVEQVFGSRPDLLAPPARGSSLLVALLVGGVMAVAGFLIAAVIFRRPRKRTAEGRPGA